MDVVRIFGFTLLGILGAGTFLLARQLTASRRRIDQLETRLADMSDVNAVLARSQQEQPDKRRHLRLLALLPPALWVATAAGRKPALVAAAAGTVFAASAVRLDTQFSPHVETPRAEAGTTTPTTGAPVARRDPTPATTTTSTTTSVPAAAPPARINRAPAPTTTTTAPPPTTTVPAPPPTTTTLLPGTTVLDDECVLDVDKPLGLPVEAEVLCPAPAG